ncbi:MAG: alpha/beta hydrolase [bacterium]
MESITRRFQICFPRLLCLIALSLLLSSAGHGQSGQKPEALTSLPCTTRTGLHCEIYGHGEPILFLHGLGGNTYSWRYMKEPLAHYYQVILIDFRGEGKSPKPHDKHYSLEDQSELIYQFIVEHNLQRLTLVGNSYGGAVSLLLAIRLCAETDSRLAKLVLIDPGAYADHLPLFLIILRTPVLGWLAVHILPPALQILIVLFQSYYDPAKITLKQIRKYAKPIASRGGRWALLQIGKGAIPKDLAYYIKLYPTISVPTLILWGEDDHVLRRDVATRLHDAIKGSELKYIKYAGHIPQEEEPGPVVCRIKAFLMPNIICPPQTQPSVNPRRSNGRSRF